MTTLDPRCEARSPRPSRAPMRAPGPPAASCRRAADRQRVEPAERCEALPQRRSRRDQLGASAVLGRDHPDEPELRGCGEEDRGARPLGAKAARVNLDPAPGLDHARDEVGRAPGEAALRALEGVVGGRVVRVDAACAFRLRRVLERMDLPTAVAPRPHRPTGETRAFPRRSRADVASSGRSEAPTRARRESRRRRAAHRPCKLGRTEAELLTRRQVRSYARRLRPRGGSARKPLKHESPASAFASKTPPRRRLWSFRTGLESRQSLSGIGPGGRLLRVGVCIGELLGR